MVGWYMIDHQSIYNQYLCVTKPGITRLLSHQSWQQFINYNQLILLQQHSFSHSISIVKRRVVFDSPSLIHPSNIFYTPFTKSSWWKSYFQSAIVDTISWIVGSKMLDTVGLNCWIFSLVGCLPLVNISESHWNLLN